MKLTTTRLEIMPLPPHQLSLWIKNVSLLEEELDCRYQAEPMEGIFLEIVKGQLLISEQNPRQFQWHSFWLLIRKSDRVVVGSADFKDSPNDLGEVEIGYGLGKEFEHQGYMTEAVDAMCDWAIKQRGVRHVVAETELDGKASQSVLQRCGFKEYKRDRTVWWKR